MTLATAGRVLAHAGDISGFGPVRIVTGLAKEIFEHADSVRVNTRTALAISEHVTGMSEAIASILEEKSLAADPSRLEPLTKFSSVLSDVNESLRSMGKKSYLSQLLHQQRDKEDLLRLSDIVRNAFQILTVQLKIQTTVMAADLALRVESLAATHLQATEQELPLHSSIIPASQLPPKPALHFGRTSETEAVVDAITGASPGRLAVLGGPGMGKTTLSLAVLHHRSVLAHFGSKRFFVPCDAAEAQSSCLTTVADAFGIASNDAKLVRLQLREVIGTGPALIILDNFESAWEPADKRRDAEDVLQFLDSIENLSLILTLRGAERPQQVRWSRPFFPSLVPLSEAAAKQTFHSIADLSSLDGDAALDVLLARLDNIPLAVVLMANLAQVESAESLLRRWDTLETAMLVRGSAQDRLSSLNISITLSLQSPRMQSVPAAQHLLSVLALLPCGVVDTDINLWNIPQSARALSVLSQTSLIMRSSAQRIYVLAPIRSFMLAEYRPPEASAKPVFDHYFSLAQLAEEFHRSATEAHLSAIGSELANIDSVIRYVFSHCTDGHTAALKAVCSLCNLFDICGIGSGPELLPVAVKTARELGLDDCRAELLMHWARLSEYDALPGHPQTLLGEARDIYEQLANEEGVVECGLRLIVHMSPTDGVLESQRLLDLVAARGDSHSRRLAQCTASLGFCLHMSGKPRDSIAQLELAIGIMHKEFGPDYQDNFIGRWKCFIVRNLVFLGDLKAAIGFLQEASSIFEATHYAQGVENVRWQLAELFMLRGQLQKTLEFTDLLLAADKPGAGDLNIDAECLLLATTAHLRAGDIEEATAALAKLDRLTLALNTTPSVKLRALSLRSELSLLRGDFEEARVVLQVASTMIRQAITKGPYLSGPEWTSTLDAEADCIASLGDLECAAGHRDECAALMIRAVIIYMKQGSTVTCVRCLAILAEVVDDDFAERLVEALQLRLQWMGLSQELAILQLRLATIAQNRGEHELARKRARTALRYFGEIKGDWRVSVAARLAGDE